MKGRTILESIDEEGVRAYEGQTGNLISDGDVLTTALQIHSVEARHASEVRRLRGILGE
jgi:Ferritin-like domain